MARGRARGSQNGDLVLRDGSRVGVIGGGPAGSFFGYFLLDMAERVGIELDVEIHEPRDFSVPGAQSCNMCGGIVSESLVQALAAEGINLPPSVVERGIDSYVLHMREGSVRIETPLLEKRIAAVHRGAGPRGAQDWRWQSFDGFLLDRVLSRGAKLVRERVEDVRWHEGRPSVLGASRESRAYDLLAVAAGVNTSILDKLGALSHSYRPPRTTKTYICEIHLGVDGVHELFGSAMHVFLLDLPRLEFAALIPKGEHVTLCLLGERIDADLVRAFLASPEVRRCLPPGWSAPKDLCRCAPHMNVGPARRPYADRVVFVGDSGVARLYKDGIGSAYRTAKAAAVTAVFDGISGDAFGRRFARSCRAIQADNAIGRLVFAIAGRQRSQRSACRGILRMAAAEQRLSGNARRMSMVLWDVFTGSAPYREVFVRTLHPLFWGRLLWEIGSGIATREPARERPA